MLADGSVIADEYREFVERIEGKFQLIWNERSPIFNFGNQKATITLNDDKQIKIDFPEDIWIAGNQTPENGVTKFVISKAVLRSDVTKLKVADFADNGSNLNLKLVDLAAKSDVLSTEFKIKYRTKSDDGLGSFSEYQTRYEGKIPAELVIRDYNRFILAIGKLPIKSEYLRSGVEADIEVIAIRSLGERSAQQKITWKASVRGNTGMRQRIM